MRGKLSPLNSEPFKIYSGTSWKVSMSSGVTLVTIAEVLLYMMFVTPSVPVLKAYTYI
jgi:hypothetical protein